MLYYADRVVKKKDSCLTADFRPFPKDAVAQSGKPVTESADYDGGKNRLYRKQKKSRRDAKKKESGFFRVSAAFAPFRDIRMPVSDKVCR